MILGFMSYLWVALMVLTSGENLLYNTIMVLIVGFFIVLIERVFIGLLLIREVFHGNKMAGAMLMDLSSQYIKHFDKLGKLGK